MPQYPPERVSLSAPRLRSWISPRLINEVSPSWVGREIVLAHQPYVLYEAYQWTSNTFKGVGATLNDIASVGTGYARFYPVRLKIQGAFATDKTDYRSQEIPQLADYAVTNRIEFYLDSRRLITNVAIDTLKIPRSAVIVTYAHITDGVRLKALLRTNAPHQVTQGPSVDMYKLTLIEGYHPAGQK